VLLILTATLLTADTLSIKSEKFSFEKFFVSKYVDPSNSLSIDEIKDLKFEIKVPNSYSNGFFPKQSIWHKFSLKNSLSKDIEFIFYDAQYHLPAEMDFYVLDDQNNILHSHFGGFNRSDSKRSELEHSLSFHRMQIKAGEQYTFFIKSYFFNGNSSLFNYQVHDVDSHVDNIILENIFMALLLGGIMTLILYNLFIYLYTRDRIYLYYVAYLFFSFVIGFVFMSGFVYKLFEISHNEWIHNSTYATPLTLVFILIFTSKVFDMKSNYPKIHRFFSLSIYFVAIYVALSVVFGLLAYLPLIMMFAMFMGLVLVFIGIYMIYVKNKLGVIYLASTATYAFFAVLTIIYYLGYLPTNLFTSNALMIGSLIEGIGLSLLLAYRINILKKQNSSLELLSSTDALTSLYNRRHFNEVAPRELNRAKRDKRIYAFALLDIDNFKKYNDTYGHQEGDKVLVQVAKTLQNSFKRSHDIVFRLGGEEFGVVFTAKTEDVIIKLAQKAKDNIEALRIEHKLNDPFGVVTASFGLVIVEVDGSSSDVNIESIYKDVDTMLYQAKAKGRNQVCTKIF
jgi:diguanylate cyclase (GGDEF)-like protein